MTKKQAMPKDDDSGSSDDNTEDRWRPGDILYYKDDEKTVVYLLIKPKELREDYWYCHVILNEVRLGSQMFYGSYDLCTKKIYLKDGLYSIINSKPNNIYSQGEVRNSSKKAKKILPGEKQKHSNFA